MSKKQLGIIFISAVILFFGLIFVSNTVQALQTTPDINRPLFLDKSGEQDIEKQLGATAGETLYFSSSRVNNIFLFMATLIRYAGGFLGLVFLGVIVYAGFVWMTAGGNEQNIEKAKKLLFNGVIGIAIVLLSVSIWIFIVENVIKNIALENPSESEIKEWETQCEPWDYKCKCEHGDQSSC
ncbi:MAG: pilin [Patescibacteria group bacterium]|nr:pilin [Patescibacteria group bacterium]MDD5490827.1 pilin [Patescibacteria group bacterium]